MSKTIHTHYDNLKVARNAPPEVIKAAYKALSQKYHPDKNPGNPEADRIMSLINASYAVLLDDEKRKLHDKWIEEEEAAKSGFEPVQEKKNNVVKNGNHGGVSTEKNNALIKRRLKNYFDNACAKITAWPKLAVLVIFVLISAALRYPIVTIAAIAVGVMFIADSREPITQASLSARAGSSNSKAQNEVPRGEVFLYSPPPEKTVEVVAKRKAISKSKWKKLQAGMTLTDVWGLLGEPFSTDNEEENRIILYYSDDIINGPYIVLRYGKVMAWGGAGYTSNDTPQESGSRITESAPSSPPVKKNNVCTNVDDGLPIHSYNGYVSDRPILNDNGLSTFTVDNTRVENDVLVKLVEVGSSVAARTFQVKARSSHKIEGITSGVYQLMYRHRGGCYSQKADRLFELEEVQVSGGIRYSNISVTLYPVEGGNMKTKNIPPPEFDKL